MAVISPQGAAIHQLLVDDFEVIPKFALSNPMDFVYGSTLAPWPNRLEDGEYHFEGETYRFDDLDQQENKNHGLVMDRNFEIRSLSEASALLGFRFGADSGYPFDIDLEVSFRLLDSGLEVVAKATNFGSDAPFAIGFHPYLLTGENFQLSANFTQKTLQNPRMLPVDVAAIEGLSLNQDSAALETLDDCFFGASEVVLTRPDGEVVIQALENLPYFMLYRPKERLGSSGRVIAIEPQSAMANAFRNQPDACLLRTGESRVFSFAIRKR